MASVAYQGGCSIAGTVFPITGSQIYEQPNPYTGGDVVTGFASPLAWANQNLVYQGAISTHYWDSMWSTLQGLVSAAGRNTSRTVIVSTNFETKSYPSGTNCFCSELTISGNPPGLIDVSMNFASEGFTSGSAPAVFTAATSAATANQSPVPWWKSSLTTAPTGIGTAADLQSWSVSISNNTITNEYISDGSTQYPKLLQGQLTCTFRMKLINPVAISGLTNGSNAVITIAGASNRTIILPNIVWQSYGVPLPGPNNRITQELSGQSLGDGSQLACVLT